MNAPTLTTARLHLRAHRLGDFDGLAAQLAAEEARFLGGPFSRQQAWLMFGTDAGTWSIQGHGAWAVERQSDGATIGQVALSHPPHFPERELGWIIYSDYRRQGFAVEAAVAARRFAFDTLGWTTLVSYIHPENEASMAVAEALGATPCPEAQAPALCERVYRHPQGEAVQ